MRKNAKTIQESYDEFLRAEHEHKSTLDTDVQIKDGKNGKLILANLKNMTVLGGRVKIQEDIFGLTPNPAHHILLNTALGVTHSVDVFGTNQALSRRVKWFMIGNKGENPSTPLTTYKAKNYETSLYGAVPFRCVPESADLSSVDAAQYRLRKLITINSARYWAYYAKAFTVTTLSLLFNEGVYTPQAVHTYPVQDNDTTHPLAGGTVQSLTLFNLTVAETEFKEFYRLNNNNNLQGARLSELGLVHGLDVNNASAQNRKELAGAELFAKLIHSPVFMDEEGSSRSVDYRIYT